MSAKETLTSYTESFLFKFTSLLSHIKEDAFPHSLIRQESTEYHTDCLISKGRYTSLQAKTIFSLTKTEPDYAATWKACTASADCICPPNLLVTCLHHMWGGGNYSLNI